MWKTNKGMSSVLNKGVWYSTKDSDLLISYTPYGSSIVSITDNGLPAETSVRHVTHHEAPFYPTKDTSTHIGYGPDLGKSVDSDLLQTEISHGENWVFMRSDIQRNAAWDGRCNDELRRQSPGSQHGRVQRQTPIQVAHKLSGIMHKIRDGHGARSDIPLNLPNNQSFPSGQHITRQELPLSVSHLAPIAAVPAHVTFRMTKAFVASKKIDSSKEPVYDQLMDGTSIHLQMKTDVNWKKNLPRKKKKKSNLAQTSAHHRDHSRRSIQNKYMVTDSSKRKSMDMYSVRTASTGSSPGYITASISSSPGYITARTDSFPCQITANTGSSPYTDDAVLYATVHKVTRTGLSSSSSRTSWIRNHIQTTQEQDNKSDRNVIHNENVHQTKYGM